MKKYICTIFLILTIFVGDAFAEDFKYARKYNANGDVIETAKYEEYIGASVMDYEFLGYYTKILSWGVFSRVGSDWKYTPAANYSYSGTNNGWYIFVVTIGYHSDYFYIKSDMSLVRSTFMAGGNGNYKEYVRANRPTIDRLGPTW